MMSNKGESEKRVICPYNPAHTIIPHRLQTHLVKCRKSYPDTKIVMCMYNSTHRVHEPELAFHHDHCSDRLGLDKFIFAPSNIDENKFPVPILDLEPTEYWDDEERETYNPEQHCLNNPVLRKKDTLSKAKRKNFKWEERQRMQQFSSTNESQPSVENFPQTASSVQPRRPHTFSKGVENTNELIEDDVSEMLKKIHLGANTATVPPKKELTKDKDEKHGSENISNNVLGIHRDMDNFPQLPHSSGIKLGHGAKPKTITRGRGSSFRNNN